MKSNKQAWIRSQLDYVFVTSTLVASAKVDRKTKLVSDHWSIVGEVAFSELMKLPEYPSTMEGWRLGGDDAERDYKQAVLDACGIQGENGLLTLQTVTENNSRKNIVEQIMGTAQNANFSTTKSRAMMQETSGPEIKILKQNMWAADGNERKTLKHELKRKSTSARQLR